MAITLAPGATPVIVLLLPAAAMPATWVPWLQPLTPLQLIPAPGPVCVSVPAGRRLYRSMLCWLLEKQASSITCRRGNRARHRPAVEHGDGPAGSAEAVGGGDISADARHTQIEYRAQPVVFLDITDCRVGAQLREQGRIGVSTSAGWLLKRFKIRLRDASPNAPLCGRCCRRCCRRRRHPGAADAAQGWRRTARRFASTSSWPAPA